MVAEWLRSTPLSHCTTPGHLLATQQCSGITISSPDHSHYSGLYIQFFPCPLDLDVSQTPPTQKYRNTFLSSFPSFLPLPHWLFGSLFLVPVTTVFPPSQLIWTPQTFLHMRIKTDKGVHPLQPHSCCHDSGPCHPSPGASHPPFVLPVSIVPSNLFSTWLCIHCSACKTYFVSLSFSLLDDYQSFVG